MKKISTSIFVFEDLINNGMCYVDKTRYLHKLITSDKELFCSRPRRFGKSLAISTLEAIFQGKRELFKGLFIDSTDYDWKTYPVIHIDFGDCDSKNVTMLEQWLNEKTDEIAARHQVVVSCAGTSANRFSRLIKKLGESSPVVVLVDEYDKVVNDNADKDVETVTELRETLRAFYAPIKTLNRYIRFAFITGVTKYTKMGIFSELNNLTDISMDEDYATMFGYTQEELEKNFSDYIELGMRKTGLDREAYLGKMREMYDGYRFEEDAPKVYNPVSVGLFFSNGGKKFEPYWFETGGNTKLVMNVAKEVDFNIAVDPEKPVSALSLTRFDIAALKGPTVRLDDLKWLLYQTGYLTIKSYNPLLKTYTLEFPNQEVAGSFSAQLLGSYAPKMPDTMLSDLVGSLVEGRLEKFFTLLEGVYASIDYPSKDPGEYDFAIVLKTLAYVYDPVVAMGEVHTSQGRADMVVRLEGVIYLFEFKVDKSAEEALRQIEEKQYWQRFVPEEKPIHLVGVSFSKEKRNIVDWKEKTLKVD